MPRPSQKGLASNTCKPVQPGACIPVDVVIMRSHNPFTFVSPRPIMHNFRLSNGSQELAEALRPYDNHHVRATCPELTAPCVVSIIPPSLSRGVVCLSSAYLALCSSHKRVVPGVDRSAALINARFLVHARMLRGWFPAFLVDRGGGHAAPLSVFVRFWLLKFGF